MVVTQQNQRSAAIVIHCGGSGQRADSKGSGFAWLRVDTNKRHVQWVDGLTNIQAEYRAILSALSAMSEGASVRVHSSSEVVCNQLYQRCGVNDPSLADLRKQILRVKREHELTVSVKWIPKTQNRAKWLLKRAKRKP